MNKVELLGTAEECLEKYQGLIKTFCKKYLNLAKYNGLEWEDIYQEACIALYQAYESYDPERKTEDGRTIAFGTLAHLKLRRDVLTAILKSNSGLSTSLKVKEVIYKIKINKWENLSNKEIAEKIGKSERFIKSIRENQEKLKTVSIENSMEVDEDKDFHNILGYEDNTQENIEFKNAISKLTKLERTVVEMKELGLKHREIGDILGKTTNAITTNFRRAKHKLQKELMV